jgi:hypothetical protein
MRVLFPPLQLGADPLNLRGRWALRQAAEEAYARRDEVVVRCISRGCEKPIASVYATPLGSLFVSDPLAQVGRRARAEIARGLIPEGRELIAFSAKFHFFDLIDERSGNVRMDIAEQNKLVENWWRDEPVVVKNVQGWKDSPWQPAHGPALPLILDLLGFRPPPGIEPWHPSRLAVVCPARREVEVVDLAELVGKVRVAKRTGKRQEIHVRPAQRA